MGKRRRVAEQIRERRLAARPLWSRIEELREKFAGLCIECGEPACRDHRAPRRRKPPWGLINRATRRAVVAAFHAVVDGQGDYAAAVRLLNNREVPAPGRGPWSPHNLRTVIADERYRVTFVPLELAAKVDGWRRSRRKCAHHTTSEQNLREARREQRKRRA